MSNGFWSGAGSGAIGSFGSLLGSGLGIISANHQSGKAYQRMLDAMKYQAQTNYDYSKLSAENSPTWNRTGLEKAGYNPMLAVQNSTSGVNSNWTGSQSAPQDQATDAITNGIANGTDFARLLNETKTQESQQDLNYATADKVKAEKQSILEKLPFIGKREKAEIQNTEKNTLMLESQIHNIDETTRFIEKNYELQRELGYLQSMTGIHIANIGSNATTSAAKIAADAAISNTDSSNKNKTINQIIGTLGTLAGVGLGGMFARGAVPALLKNSPDLIKVVPKFIKFH